MSQARRNRMPRIEIRGLRYNPADAAFEALVTVYDRTEAHAYPCSLRAPLNATYETVNRAMRAKAGQQHRARMAATGATSRKIGDVSISSHIMAEIPDSRATITGRRAA